MASCLTLSVKKAYLEMSLIALNLSCILRVLDNFNSGSERIIPKTRLKLLKYL